MNGNNTNYDVLIKKGILNSKNGISHDKINLISGTMTAPLLETIWTFSGNNSEGMNRILNIFSQFYNAGREIDMLAILQILFDVVGMDLPDDVELLAGHPEARQYFLFSFVLDMEDCIQDLRDEFIIEGNDIS